VETRQESANDHPPGQSKDRRSHHGSSKDRIPRLSGPREHLLPVAGSESGAGAGLAAAADFIVGRIVDRVIDALAGRLAELIPEPTPELLDRKGLAQFLGVSLPTVDKLRAEGCPVLMIVESPRFERERVLEWLRSRA
jgi:hypothetical protein